jgi:hypothetical protein
LGEPFLEKMEIDKFFWEKPWKIIPLVKFIPKIIYELEVHERKFGFCMRTRVMDDAQGSYSHGEEIKGLRVSMSKVET